MESNGSILVLWRALRDVMRHDVMSFQYLFEQAECTAMTHSTDGRGFALAIANPRPSPKLTISFLPQLKQYVYLGTCRNYLHTTHALIRLRVLLDLCESITYKQIT